jgi:hypothetical protein
MDAGEKEDRVAMSNGSPKVRLLWHERVEDEPWHEWLHEVLRRATGELRHGRERLAPLHHTIGSPHCAAMVPDIGTQRSPSKRCGRSDVIRR